MKKVWSVRFACLSLVSVSMVLPGCGGGTEVKLADVPPAQISPNVQGEATADKASLKKGAPAKGSSAGINFNPSDSSGSRR